MEALKVKINSTSEYFYPILIEDNLFSNPYEYISKYTKAQRFLVVTNEKVYSLYGKAFEHDNSAFIILPDGEEYKNLEVLSSILDKAIALNIERKDAIIALGGGVIGDMAGFAASIYQRGIDFIQVPTTLLAQVDSSVGGKVAVNHSRGKNLIGSFYQPKLVLADTSVLDSLDERQFKTGRGEVLKYAFIEKTCCAKQDYKFLEYLEKNRSLILQKDKNKLKEIIKISCELKSAVVNQDEKEKGLRAILNFGHTYAHAIEAVTKYMHFTHGEAVSIGMKLIFDLALKLSFIDSNYYSRAVNLLNDYGLITSIGMKMDKEEFYTAMKADKKVSSGNINFVMPIGEKTVKIMNGIDKKLVLCGI